jgi:hypothetical protein
VAAGRDQGGILGEAVPDAMPISARAATAEMTNFMTSLQVGAGLR